jgi:hypothetical protein
MPRLFAVVLGGNCAPRSNTELHDVVFVAGERIEDTFADLCDLWFGTLEGLHVDSWLELDRVDGYRVSLAREGASGPTKLFFVNLGGYQPGVFAELHACTFLAAASEDEAKARAKATLMRGLESVHTDDLYDVDDCLEIGEVAGYRVALEETGEAAALEPRNGWLPLPDEVIQAGRLRRASA